MSRQDENVTGRLYGLGLGPGTPAPASLKTLRLLRAAPRLVNPAASLVGHGDEGLAAATARLPEDVLARHLAAGDAAGNGVVISTVGRHFAKLRQARGPPGVLDRAV